MTRGTKDFVHAKHRYLTLDGLRGIAALFVFIRHSSPKALLLLGHSYIAVDIFFALSGFVLATTYDHALCRKSLLVSTFILKRFIRLAPLFILGSSLDFISIIIIDQRWGWHLLDATSWKNGAPYPALVSAYVLSLGLLPAFFSSKIMFPLNGPAWTLFYELIVNYVFALFRSRKLTLVLVATTGLACIGLMGTYLCHRTLDAGVYWNEIPLGLMRSFYSFGIGYFLVPIRQLLAKKLTPKVNNFGSYCVLLAVGALIAMPSSANFGSRFDLFAILFVSPSLILIGSFVEPKGKSALVAASLGLASYGIYILQVPLSNLAVALLPTFDFGHMPLIGTFVYLVCLLVTVLCLDKCYDRPFRGRLEGILKSGKILKPESKGYSF